MNSPKTLLLVMSDGAFSCTNVVLPRTSSSLHGVHGRKMRGRKKARKALLPARRGAGSVGGALGLTLDLRWSAWNAPSSENNWA